MPARRDHIRLGGHRFESCSRYFKGYWKQGPFFIFKKLASEFPFVSICIWSTSVINEFMLHQPGRFTSS
ncbi:DUF6577 family protein [Lunatimonas salinarum]|uniref:DUF6577 family protein n=1 Tax=Lunatimonas salinarum TaxID=1774590 RepID=UPI003CC90E5B